MPGCASKARLLPFRLRATPPEGRKAISYQLLDLLTIDRTETLEGISYVPVLREEQGTMRDLIFTKDRDRMLTVRDERFKLIHYISCDRIQVFDLREDPHEMNDLLVAWRRDPVYAAIPDSPVMEESKGQSDPLLNPEYQPQHSRQFVDEKCAELSAALDSWLVSECGQSTAGLG